MESKTSDRSSTWKKHSGSHTLFPLPPQISLSILLKRTRRYMIVSVLVRSNLLRTWEAAGPMVAVVAEWSASAGTLLPPPPPPVATPLQTTPLTTTSSLAASTASSLRSRSFFLRIFFFTSFNFFMCCLSFLSPSQLSFSASNLRDRDVTSKV